jgi:tetratricopeptide (TPR) repeat protein
LVSDGKINRTDLVRVEGKADWIPADEIPALRALLEASEEVWVPEGCTGDDFEPHRSSRPPPFHPSTSHASRGFSWGLVLGIGGTVVGLSVVGTLIVLFSHRDPPRSAELDPPAGRVSHDPADASTPSIPQNSAVASTPENQAITEFDKGLEFSARRDWEKAIARYTEAIRLKPDDADAYYLRGNAYEKSGESDQAIKDWGKAISCYRKAIRLNPDDAHSYHFRGNAYYSLAEFDKAIRDYTAAIRLMPTGSTSYNNRGNAYDKKGEHDKAIADYTEAIRITPDDAIAYMNRARAYSQAGDMAKSSADYDTARAIEDRRAPPAPHSLTALRITYPVGELVCDATKSKLTVEIGRERQEGQLFSFFSVRDRSRTNSITFGPLSQSEMNGLANYLSKAYQQFKALDPLQPMRVTLPVHIMPRGRVTASVYVDDGNVHGSVMFQNNGAIDNVGFSAVSVRETIDAERRPTQNRKPDQLSSILHLIDLAYLRCQKNDDGIAATDDKKGSQKKKDLESSLATFGDRVMKLNREFLEDTPLVKVLTAGKSSTKITFRIKLDDSYETELVNQSKQTPDGMINARVRMFADNLFGKRNAPFGPSVPVSFLCEYKGGAWTLKTDSVKYLVEKMIENYDLNNEDAEYEARMRSHMQAIDTISGLGLDSGLP